MALIKCPECGKMISDKAKRCNGCGMERGGLEESLSSVKELIEEKPVAEIAEQPQKPKTHNVTEKDISKNFDIKVLILGLAVGLIIWSAVLVYIVNSSFDKKLEKILGSVESSNTITEQGEVVDEINNAEMMVDDEEEKREESLENESTEETQQEESYNPQEIRDGKVVFGTYNKDVELIFTKTEYVGEYTKLFFLVTNKGVNPIKLNMDPFQYLNGISIERAYVIMNDEIPAGKSTQLELCFNKLDRVLQENIESIEIRMNMPEQRDNELIFYADGFNIPFK